MKRFYLTGAIAVLAIAVPATAHAQLLGGSGGIGGAIGGTLGGGGAIGGTVGSTLDAPADSLRSTTRGAASATTNVQGNKSVDTNTGSVATNGSVDAAASGGAAQMLDTPLAGLIGNAEASSSASANGGVNAQLVGTDHRRCGGRWHRANGHQHGRYGANDCWKHRIGDRQSPCRRRFRRRQYSRQCCYRP